MVDNNDKPITIKPNFNKPFFSSKKVFRKGKIINAIMIPRNICKKRPNTTIGVSIFLK